MKKKLELYGTLGPCCHSKAILKQMFHAGMTGLRLNLSHTNLSDCSEWLQNLYEVSEELRIVPDLLIDMQGPELRIGSLPAPLSLKKEMFVNLVPVYKKDSHTAPLPFSPNIEIKQPAAEPEIPIPHAVFPYLKKGQLLRLDDGNIILSISQEPAAAAAAESNGNAIIKSGGMANNEAAENSRVIAKAKVIAGGILTSRKSLAIDGVSIDLPSLTSQDLQNLDMVRQYRVTGVMLPFVRGKDDIINLKRALYERKLTNIRIFAKIENKKGVEQLSTLLPHCDYIVIARGDLGNAYPLPKLPAVQKQIARACRLTKTPFMVVTQMLASMSAHPVPTRAEVSDIFNAVLDGASALMLTGETAAGSYPAEAIQMLADTAYEGLRFQIKERFPFTF